MFSAELCSTEYYVCFADLPHKCICCSNSWNRVDFNSAAAAGENAPALRHELGVRNSIICKLTACGLQIFCVHAIIKKNDKEGEQIDTKVDTETNGT